MKSKTSPVASSLPAPSQTTVLLGCPVPRSAIRETRHRDSPVAGRLCGNVHFSCSFCSKFHVDISKSSVLHVSQGAFPSASFSQSTHFCCQTSLQILFNLDVHKSYSTMWWPLLSNVLLSLVPPGLFCLFPLWHVPFRLQTWRKGLSFFYARSDTLYTHSAWVTFSFRLCDRTSCSLHSFLLPLQTVLYCSSVKLPSQV